VSIRTKEMSWIRVCRAGQTESPGVSAKTWSLSARRAEDSPAENGRLDAEQHVGLVFCGYRAATAATGRRRSDPCVVPVAMRSAESPRHRRRVSRTSATRCSECRGSAFRPRVTYSNEIVRSAGRSPPRNSDVEWYPSRPAPRGIRPSAANSSRPDGQSVRLRDGGHGGDRRANRVLIGKPHGRPSPQHRGGE